MWSKDLGCLMSADYWGPPKVIVQSEELCPVPQELQESGEVVLTEAASLFGGLAVRAQ